MSESTKEVLCSLDDLEEPGSLGFYLPSDQGPREIFLVRKGDLVFAYQNHCPHTGINLEWQADQFLDPGGSFIQCATHGALFRIEDGYCLRGPCAGESLQPVCVDIEKNEVVFYPEAWE